MKSFQSQTHYEVLEVSVAATATEVRHAYERLSQLYSDDQVVLYGLVDPDRAAALRTRLKEALEVLTDEQRRDAYDVKIGLPPRLLEKPPAPRPTAPPKPSSPPSSASGWGSFSWVTPGTQVAPSASAGSYTYAAAPTAPVAAPAPVLVVPVPARVVAETRSVVVSAPKPAEPVAAAPRQLALEVNVPSPGWPVRGEEPLASTVSPPASAPVSAAAPERAEAPSPVQVAVSAVGVSAVEAPPSLTAPVVVMASPSASLAAPPAVSAVESPDSVAVVSATAAVAAPAPSAPVAAAQQSAAVMAPPPSAPVAAPAPSAPVAAPAPSAPVAAPLPSAPVAAPAPSAPVTAPPPSMAALSPPVVAPPAPVIPAPYPSIPVPIITAPAAPAPAPAAAPEAVLPPPPSIPVPIVTAPPAAAPSVVAPPPTPAAPPAVESSEPPVPQLADETVEVSIVPMRATPSRDFKVEQRPRPYEIPEGVEINGDLLRQVRMAKGLTLAQVADRTRIGLKHLENLEADRYDALPVSVYLRGILMSLARELGLDGLRVSRSYLTFVEAHRSKD